VCHSAAATPPQRRSGHPAARLSPQSDTPWRARMLTQNTADSEVLNEVSLIVLKIDIVFVIGTTHFQF
jgi:hypothetical protein